MPEGDTIHRAAAALRDALGGRALTRVDLPRLPRPWPAVGAEVTGVEARGKHLLIRTSDGLVLHTHQRMTGSWHLYTPGERWRRSARAARAVLGVPGAVAVCFASPVVEVLDAAGVARHPVLRRLGPDLCDPGADLDDALARFGRLSSPERSVGEALLDQRIACGVGNVYRCDVLFLHGLHPTTPVGAVDEGTRRALLTTAAELLRANLASSARTTVPGGPAGSLWVYGRGGRPCRRCGTPIRTGSLGEPPRPVAWCPTCQPADLPPGVVSPPSATVPRVSTSSTPRPAHDGEPLVPAPQLAAWRAFLTAHARITEVLARELRDREGLPLTWYDVLVQLSEADGHRLRMQELAERVLLSKSGLTRLIDRMEQEGLVSRSPCPDDRRGTFAQMTDVGYERIRRTAPTHLAGVRTHFADHLDDGEAAAVAAALSRVAEALGRNDAGDR